MSREPSLSSPIAPQPSPPQQNDDSLPQNDDVPATQNDAPPPVTTTTRSNRPSRACTVRTAARLHAAALQQSLTLTERRQKPKKERNNQQLQRNDESPQQCSGTNKIVTPLVGPPEPSQLQRWSLRSMWELSSVLNFLNVFGPLLNIAVEFSAEELETALITPNDTLSDLHIPLLKAIPPVTRMALTRDTWITVLCRKLRDWWHWVADGDLPIVASHGVEIEVYRTLDPGVRVVILKALCDIRVEQEDIRNYIENSLKHGVQLSLFRKERIEGDSHGVNYWYEDDPVIGHRLYREIRKIELKKVKAKGSQTLPNATYQWETVATNLEEFQDVSEKLFQSNNRTEASLGKRLKNDMLPEIEKVHKRKEKLLKKQHRQALLLDNFLNMDGLGPGRSMRDRKAVTYTFDDYDRSIDEAIKITKEKPPSPEPIPRRKGSPKPEGNSNGKLSGPSHEAQLSTFSSPSPNSPDYNDLDEEHNPESLDRSNRRRQRPQRYSEKEFVKGLKANSDNDADIDSDDEIVGEAVYDEEYLRKRKQRKLSSSSEGDEEYHGDEENAEDEEEEEEEDCLGISEDSDEPRKFKKLSGRTRRETKLRSVDELQLGLRRSKRSIKNRINYQQYELTESEAESVTDEKSNASDEHSDASENAEYSEESQDSDVKNDNQELKNDNHDQGYPGTVDKEQSPKQEKSNSPGQDEIEGVQKMRFLDLNEVAPGSGFDDGPNSIIKDEGRDDL